MSLLLDALQRAAKEKAKAAEVPKTAAEPAPVPSVGAIEPLPSLELAVEPEAAPIPAAVELSIEPISRHEESTAKSPPASVDPVAEVGLEPGDGATTSAPMAESGIAFESAPTPVAGAHSQVSASLLNETPPILEAKLEVNPARGSDEAKTASTLSASPSLPSYHEPAAKEKATQAPREEASPRIAREILAAKPIRRLNPRLVALASLVLLVAAAYMAFMLGAFNRFFGTTTSSLIPSNPPPAAPSKPAPLPAAAAPDAPVAGDGAAAKEIAPIAGQPQSASGRQIDAGTDKRAEDAPSSVPTRRARSARAAARDGGAIDKPVTVSRSPGPNDLDLAYAALQEGKLDDARASYRKVLERNANERDALLGLAYIAHRLGAIDEARIHYQQVLRLEPGNPTANAGMLAIGAEGDLARTATRAREFADQSPESATALAAVGAVLVREGRIAEAQQAFFKALTLEPDNPLHCYNLAVALDRLHKYGPALTYYARTLQLAEKANAILRSDLPLQQARKRMEELQQAAPAKVAPDSANR